MMSQRTPTHPVAFEDLLDRVMARVDAICAQMDRFEQLVAHPSEQVAEASITQLAAMLDEVPSPDAAHPTQSAIAIARLAIHADLIQAHNLLLAYTPTTSQLATFRSLALERCQERAAKAAGYGVMSSQPEGDLDKPLMTRARPFQRAERSPKTLHVKGTGQGTSAATPPPRRRAASVEPGGGAPFKPCAPPARVQRLDEVTRPAQVAPRRFKPQN